jgi:hypothetical protein
LRIEIKVFKNIRRKVMRQHAKDDHLFVFRQIDNHFSHISRRPFTKHFTERGEIPRLDHAPDFRF